MHRLLSVAEMREADQRAIAGGRPGIDLMNAAGRAVADAVLARIGDRDLSTVLVLCGPGNNGGDGFVCARLLAEQGIGVRVGLLGRPEAVRGDAALALAAWRGPMEDARVCDPNDAAVVVDALFGSGLTRDLDGDAARVVSRINESGRPVVAVDVPSGLDADTGAIRGVAVRANATVTFARLKPGHLLLPGRRLCGQVICADIGIDEAIIDELAPRTFANGPALWDSVFPEPPVDAHKYTRGHALVLSGDATRTGAARLTARAALRVGAGAVTLASPRAALAVNAAHLTAIMLVPCDGALDLTALLSDERLNAIGLGPALGRGGATRDLVTAAATARRTLMLDADALTSFEDDARSLAGIVDGTQTVITPHAGEFRRLFSQEADVLDAPSRLAQARAGAVLLGVVVVLKGADSVIAAPDGRAAINATGSPYLATAGSGDVLGGLVTGLMAQGMPAFEAACAAVWLHGKAGERAGPGLIAEDLPELIPTVLRDLLATQGTASGHLEPRP